MLENGLKNERGLASLDMLAIVLLLMVLFLSISLSPSLYKQSKLAQADDSDLNFKLVDTVKITALQDNIGASANFYLGSGTVSSEMKYFYQVKKNGGYVTKAIPSQNVIIYETKENPRIEKYEGVLKEEFMIDYFDYFKKFYPKKTKVQYRVYVPQGSVLHNYNVDLK